MGQLEGACSRGCCAVQLGTVADERPRRAAADGQRVWACESFLTYMLDSPDTLVGRLQRGRGDAVREVLRMPIDSARQALLRCLCTEGDLSQHHDGFVELVVALSPDLAPWYRWIEALGSGVTEETREHAFNMLGALCARGYPEARAFLDRYVMEGSHWQDALSQYLVEGVDLGLASWSALLARVDDETLATHVYCKLDAPLWDALAVEHERVAAVVREQRDRRSRREASQRWSPDNYASAELSQRRWRVLESLMKRDPEASVPYLIDGLWDGSYGYRDRCIQRCDLGWPGVRERLAELACMQGSRSAAAARRRITESLEQRPDRGDDRGPARRSS